jgi:WD40 repeat protein
MYIHLHHFVLYTSMCDLNIYNHLIISSYIYYTVLWDIAGASNNYNVLTGHKNAVLEVKWSSQSNNLVSCSADKTVAIWDANKGVRCVYIYMHIHVYVFINI